MEISDIRPLALIGASGLVGYYIGIVQEHYDDAIRWIESHPGASPLFYEDIFSKSKSIENKIGKIARNMAYKHSKVKIKE